MLKRSKIYGFFLLFSCIFNIGVVHAGAAESYDDLVALFKEWRDFEAPELIEGVPQYTPAAMQKKEKGLQVFRKRLRAIDTSGWPVSSKADYYLVQAEMNGFEFYLRVLRPWFRDPVFYLPFQGSAGPAMQGLSFWEYEFPLSEEDKKSFSKSLIAVPNIYDQAKANLTEAASDLAAIAINAIEQETSFYEQLEEGFAETHPDLQKDVRNAQKALRDYGKWLEKKRPTMTAAAGIGKENYNWWLQKVHLFPYTWEKSKTTVENEYSRVVTFLMLEEHRNRELPPINVVRTVDQFYANLFQSINYTIDFLRDKDFLTVPDWLQADIYVNEDSAAMFQGDVTDPSVDGKIRRREILPGEAGHEFTGHALDGMAHSLDKRVIRGADPLFNMAWLRTEGWAVALEELLMQAGILDERPRRGREIVYLMNSSHVSFALPDLKMHNNEINFEQAVRYCADLMPRGWSEHDGTIWQSPESFEIQSTLRFPGFHTGVLTGKAYIMKMMREQVMKLGDKFVLKDFVDQFRGSGIIPLSLIRMEMTGDESEVRELLDF